MSGKISAGQIFYGYVIPVGLLDLLGQSIAAFAIDVWPNLIITVPISTIVLDSETGKSIIIDLIWSYIERYLTIIHYNCILYCMSLFF